MIPIRYNLRSLATRKTNTAATILGIALVVFVLAASLMLSAGVKKTLTSSGRADVAIVTRKGSDAELSSIVEDPQVSLVKAAPGVKKNGDRPAVIAEVVVVTTMEKLGANGLSNVTVRGVPPDVMTFRRGVELVAGRFAQPGADEAVIGARLRGRFAGLDLGQTFELKKSQPLTVVGVFEDSGSAYESEVWVDFDVVRAAYHRVGAVSAVRAMLESPAAFDAFQATIEQDKRLQLSALRETYFYEKQSEGIALFVGILGSVVAAFFSLGAMIGAAITMYAAVANRQKEIGVLRALGFARRSVLSCFLIESMLIALFGGAIGSVGALSMRFVKFSMMNFATFSEMSFTFQPTWTIVGISLAFALGMGLLGGLLPAVRAARVSPVTAMRGG
ncbi:MAG: ABC transporter permease [Polyangiaceae bacterium]|nr:ABC transporter permease [Polyangiaceae bacterium]